MKILLTGASGFIGRSLAQRFAGMPGWQTRLLLRHPHPDIAPGCEHVRIEDLATSPLGEATRGCDAVVHTAARVHVLRDTGGAPLAAYRHTNVDATLALARSAVDAGARRFVFLSSVKVHGEYTTGGRAFRADDVPAPQDDYGRSKHEAEQALHALSARTGLEVVVVRPPLVYGPGVKANFQALLRAISRRLPLPLGSIDNRRSLVALDNLVDLVTCCIDAPAAAGQAFLASDDEDLSTPELVRRIAAVMGHRPLLLPVPCGLLQAAGALAGRAAAVQRLCGSLQVDIDKTRALLGWRPPIDVDEGLRRAVAALEHR